MKRIINVFMSLVLCLSIAPKMITVLAEDLPTVTAVTTGNIKYIDSNVQFTFSRNLEESEIKELKKAEFVCVGSGNVAQITPVYSKDDNILTIKYGELEPLMYSDKTTKPAEYKLILPEESFANCDTRFVVTGSKLFEYFAVGENYSESSGIEISGGGEVFDFYDKTETERGFIKSSASFAIYGLKKTMSVNFYVDISVNVTEAIEDGLFSIRAANSNGQKSWINLLSQSGNELWNKSFEVYKDEFGWSEFRIFMQKDSAGNYIKSVYFKNKNGGYSMMGSPTAVYCRIDGQSQKVNRISWLTISGGENIKIGNISVYKENIKNLVPKIESVSYNEDGVEIVFSNHMVKDTVVAENITLYNTVGDIIEGASFEYDDLTKTLSITNSGIIDVISYGNNILTVNGMRMEEGTESRSCVISDLEIVNDNSELITSVSGVRNASAVLNTENYNIEYSDDIKTVVIAAYDSEGRLVSADFDSKKISTGVTNYLAKISFDMDVAKVKAFLWEGNFETMKPSERPIVTVPGTQSVNIESVSGIYSAVIIKPGCDTAYVRGLRRRINAPFLIDNSIMVGINDIAEVTLSPVEGDENTKTIYYTDKEISFTADSDIIEVKCRTDESEKYITMGTKVQNVDGVMYIPINDYLDVIGMSLNPYISNFIVFGEGELVTRSFTNYEKTILQSLFSDSFDENTVMTFYVASDGAEGNDGRFEAPFATVEEAIESVRKYKELNGMTGNIEVVIKEGTYYTDGITFGVEDSGVNGYNVVYKAYPGDNVKIVSGEPVTGWEKHEGSIYKARFDGTDFKMLIENEKLSHPARYPDTGYNRSIALAGGDLNTAFAFENGDIPVLCDEQNARISIWPRNVWQHVFMTVSDIDYDSRIVNTVEDKDTSLGVNSRYFIENDYNLLNCEGEFYADGEYLYYIPYNEEINDSEIIIPNKANIVTLTGETADRRVKNIVFSNLIFEGADMDYNGINISLASGITVDGCQFKNIGTTGVFADASYDVKITNCKFQDIGNDGMFFKGETISNKVLAGFHTVYGNEIIGLGKADPGEASAVSISAVDNCYIANNKISDSTRFGIDIKSSKAYAKTINLAYEDWDKYVRGQNNVIEGNDISDVCNDSMDGGAIYMWCAGKGNIVRRNRLHHSTSPVSFWFPVYLDDGSDRASVYDNIVDNNQNYESEGEISYLFFFKGVENVMFNNIAVNNQNFSGASKDFASFGTHSMAEFANDRVVNFRNIFYNSGDKFVRIAKSGNTGIYYTPATTRIAKQDYNIHYNESGNYLPDVYSKSEGINITSLEDWKSWQDNKYDQNSLFGVNPEFIDVENYDFRLKPESKAYELGFTDIDFGSIGLPKGYMFADKNDVLENVYIITSDKKNSLKELLVGESINLKITGRTKNGYFIDSDSAEISYKSSDEDIAVVDENGKITALAQGSAVITAEAQYNGVIKDISINILVN